MWHCFVNKKKTLLRSVQKRKQPPTRVSRGRRKKDGPLTILGALPPPPSLRETLFRSASFVATIRRVREEGAKEKHAPQLSSPRPRINPRGIELPRDAAPCVLWLVAGLFTYPSIKRTLDTRSQGAASYSPSIGHYTATSLPRAACALKWRARAVELRGDLLRLHGNSRQVLYCFNRWEVGSALAPKYLRIILFWLVVRDKPKPQLSPSYLNVSKYPLRAQFIIIYFRFV